MRFFSLFIFLMSMLGTLHAQLASGVYFSSTAEAEYELKVKDNYLVLSTYKADPPEFLQTIGGFYELVDDHIKLTLEFNSEYEKDSIRSVDIPFQEEGGIIIFRMEPELVFNKVTSISQDLDAAWLFATRGPDTGQERRGDENARKTLKLLIDGRFQWIAYNTETMKFHGSGGGSYSSSGGKYTERIEYFSRDNSRVGAELGFDFELKDGDWHHTGLNSKGKPMYEIWAKR